MTERIVRATSGAAFDATRTYRYHLWREWGDGPPFVVIGLNPSTADESADDPTIRRCISFAKRERCGRLDMLNLFALRSTDPRAVVEHFAPVGPENDRYLMECTVTPNARVVAAWGSSKGAAWRSAELLALLTCDVVCLGFTKDGAPRHPLYVRGDAPLLPFKGAA